MLKLFVKSIGRFFAKVWRKFSMKLLFNCACPCEDVPIHHQSHRSLALAWQSGILATCSWVGHGLVHRLFWAFWHPQGRQRKDAIHKLCWIGHGIIVTDLFFLGLCLWYFGHAGCDEQIGCRAGFNGRQAQSLWTDTALGLRSIIGWEMRNCV